MSIAAKKEDKRKTKKKKNTKKEELDAKHSDLWRLDCGLSLNFMKIRI